MDEFQKRAGASGDGRKPLLQEILDGLDVVVGRLLYFLDATRIIDGELRGETVHSLRLRGGKTTLADLRFGGEGLEPCAFDEDAALDEAVLGEHLPQLGALSGVASVDRAYRKQRIDFHVIHP